ncbi:MAG: YihY/virulence factor BrkB family protein [Bacilli bacterium]
MKRVRKFIKNFINAITQPEMQILPGQLAFFFFLSVVPIITLISYGASFLNLPMDFISAFIENAFGANTKELIMPMVTGTSIDLGYIIFLIFGFIIASNGASSIIITSNILYDIKDSGFFKRRLKSLVMTLVIVLLFVFILVIPVFGDKILDMIKLVNFNSAVTNKIETIFNLIKGPTSWIVIFGFIRLIYILAPDRKQSSYVNYGAIFTTAGWVGATFIYSYYVNNFAHYDILYGGLANIVVLMLWVYLLAFIFVIGMALNIREENEHTKQIETLS